MCREGRKVSGFGNYVRTVWELPAVAENLAADVRVLLMEQREVGVDFDTAWERATYAVLGDRDFTRPETEAGTSDRARWRAAIEAARGEFRAAYYREPTRVAESLQAMIALFEDAGAEVGLS